MSVSANWGQVIARHSGKVLDSAGGSSNPGGQLQQWNFIPNQANQRFRFERLDDGFYVIRVMHTGLVLDVTGGSREQGAQVVQWGWHGGDNQQWNHATSTFD